MPSLIHLPRRRVLGPLTPAGQRPGADRGDPQLHTLPADTCTQAQIGIWECQPGGWPVIDRPDTETCYIICGRATLTDAESGTAIEICAGDFVILPLPRTPVVISAAQSAFPPGATPHSPPHPDRLPVP